jgi:broad specificity phosphatase PhoE
LSPTRWSASGAPLAPAAAAFGLPLDVDPRFDEYDMDDILSTHSDTAVRANVAAGTEPVSSAEYQRALEIGMSAWIAAGDASPAAETWPAFSSRTTAGLTDLAAGLPSGSTALVFTSAGVIAALCCAMLTLPAATLITLNRVSVNAAISKVASGRSGLTLVSFNEHGYLEGSEPSLVTLR